MKSKIRAEEKVTVKLEKRDFNKKNRDTKKLGELKYKHI